MLTIDKHAVSEASNGLEAFAQVRRMFIVRDGIIRYDNDTHPTALSVTLPPYQSICDTPTQSMTQPPPYHLLISPIIYLLSFSAHPY